MSGFSRGLNEHLQLRRDHCRGGSAGASAVIHLATRGARCCWLNKVFPVRSYAVNSLPECANTRSAGPHYQMYRLTGNLAETVFYSRNGSKVSVPSSWFGSDGVALGLSRAEMDERLLRRAYAAGATVLEDAHVTDLVFEDGQVQGVTIRAGSQSEPYRAAITIDATGRTRALARRLSAGKENAKPRRPPMIAFKAHLENTLVAPGVCEIYFYRRGYGGSAVSKMASAIFASSRRRVTFVRVPQTQIA